MRMDEGKGDSLPSLLVEVRVRKSLYAQGPSERFSRVPGGPCLNPVRGAPMRIVDADCSRVEAALQAGELAHAARLDHLGNRSDRLLDQDGGVHPPQAI